MTAQDEGWFKGVLIHETEMAVYVRLDDDEKDRWFPKSAVEDITQDAVKGERIDIQLAEWLVEKEALR